MFQMQERKFYRQSTQILLKYTFNTAMNNKLLVLFLMLFSATSFASGGLDIIVNNDTPYSCELIDAHAVKKSAEPFSIIKTTLVSSEMTRINLHDSLSDIDYVLSYRCGNIQVGYKKVTFSSKQSGHFIYARPYGETQSDLTDQGITAIIEDTTASVANPVTNCTRGEIFWSIRMQ